MSGDAEALVAAATALVEAADDGAVHTVAAAGRTTSGRVVTGLNLSHFTGGPYEWQVQRAPVGERRAEPTS